MCRNLCLVTLRHKVLLRHRGTASVKENWMSTSMARWLSFLYRSLSLSLQYSFSSFSCHGTSGLKLALSYRLLVEDCFIHWQGETIGLLGDCTNIKFLYSVISLLQGPQAFKLSTNPTSRGPEIQLLPHWQGIKIQFIFSIFSYFYYYKPSKTPFVQDSNLGSVEILKF